MRAFAQRDLHGQPQRRGPTCALKLQLVFVCSEQRRKRVEAAGAARAEKGGLASVIFGLHAVQRRKGPMGDGEAVR